MTFTELKAKPGHYIWNENEIQFVGRINKDGTEDKRFSRGGVCSMLNNIIKETGYVPTNPQAFATKIAEHKSNNYLVKGYGVIVKCYDLSAEMWVAKAAEHLGVEGDGIADILRHVSKSKTSEHKAKVETLALIFGKELKSSKLADYAGVTEFEKRLKNERAELAKSKSEKLKADKLKQWIHSAFSNPTILMKTCMPMFEVRGYPGGQRYLWVLCNVTLRWCLQNKSIKRAIESRYYRDKDEFFKKNGVSDLPEYAWKFAKEHLSAEDYEALDDIETYHTCERVISDERYAEAKKIISKAKVNITN